MAANEVMQHVKKHAHMIAVAARLGSPNIVDDHSANLFVAVRFMHQIVAIGGSDAFGHVLVLGNGEDFRLGQIAHSDNVIERDHDAQ